MLKDFPVCPIFPVADLEQAKDFYENKLGLPFKDVGLPGFGMFDAGQGSMIGIYEKKDHVQSDFTQAGFNVTDLEGLMKELAEKGVQPEHYDMPGLKTDENGIVTMGSNKSAWIKDPDGNIIALNQM